MVLTYKVVYTYEEINGKYSCILEKYFRILCMQARDDCAIGPLSKSWKIFFIQEPTNQSYVWKLSQRQNSVNFSRA